MIYTAKHWKKDQVMEADLCVIGTGAGGASVVYENAMQGKKVIALEAGSFWMPKDFTQLEHDMFPRLYHEKAGRTTENRAIQVHQGKGVGGSTLHNINLCARISRYIYDEWDARVGLQSLPWGDLEKLYEEMEKRFNVTTLSEAEMNPNNRILREGCKQLGYKGGFLQHNRKGCVQSGFCELGCSFDAKQNAMKILMAPAIQKGAVVLADTWALRLVHENRKIKECVAWVRDPDTGKKMFQVTIRAKAFCVSASGTTSASILQRSQVPDPHGLVGSRLFLHPGAAVAGVFSQKLESWKGIPQSYECTEFLDFSPQSQKRIWILPVFAHPVGVSSILSDFGEAHAEWMKQYPYMASLSAMVHDTSCGKIRPKGEFGVSIDYSMNTEDRKQLKKGLKECTKLLLAGGAQKVVVPYIQTQVVDSLQKVDDVFDQIDISDHSMVVNSVHPMGSVWMGDRAKNSCVGTNGKYHHMDNLYVSDTSLFAGSIGGPPQLSVYSLGAHVGRKIASQL